MNDTYGKITGGLLVEERVEGIRYRRPPIEGSDGKKLSSPNTAAQLIDAGYILKIFPVIGANQTQGDLIDSVDSYTYEVIDKTEREIIEAALVASDLELPRFAYEIMANMAGPLLEVDYPTTFAEFNNKQSLLAQWAALPEE